jgi:hypothetical protein
MEESITRAIMHLREVSKCTHPKARFIAAGFDLSLPIGRQRYNDNPDDFLFTQPPAEGSEEFVQDWNIVPK